MLDLDAPPLVLLMAAMTLWALGSAMVAVLAHRATEDTPLPDVAATRRAATVALLPVAGVLVAGGAIWWAVSGGDATWSTPAFGTAAGVVVAAGLSALLETPVALRRMATVAEGLDPEASEEAAEQADDARYVVRRCSWLARGEALLLAVGVAVLAAQPTWTSFT